MSAMAASMMAPSLARSIHTSVRAASSPSPTSAGPKTPLCFRAAVAPARVCMGTRAPASAGRRAVVSVQAASAGARNHAVWGAYEVDEYPSEEFIEYCKEAFPEEGVATLEEARTLMSPEIGYKMLDVRSLYEVNLGKITGSVHVPLINAKKAGFLPGGRVALEQSANKNFLEDVKAKFPTKSTPMLVFCSDGFDRSIQALILLEKAGYTNIVGVKYGYNGWCNKFTNKLKRRRSDGYKEDYSGEGEDSAGIHASGAGFPRMDAIDKVRIKDEVEWQEWEKAVAGGYAVPDVVEEAPPVADAFAEFAAAPAAEAFSEAAASPATDAFSEFAPAPTADTFSEFAAPPAADAFSEFAAPPAVQEIAPEPPAVEEVVPAAPVVEEVIPAAEPVSEFVAAPPADDFSEFAARPGSAPVSGRRFTADDFADFAPAAAPTEKKDAWSSW